MKLKLFFCGLTFKEIQIQLLLFVIMIQAALFAVILDFVLKRTDGSSRSVSTGEGASNDGQTLKLLDQLSKRNKWVFHHLVNTFHFMSRQCDEVCVVQSAVKEPTPKT